MENAIDGAASTQNPYSLAQQAASLLTSVEVLDSPITSPIGALIFISDTSDFALKNADRWFSKLSGIEISFVLLGSGVDSVKLRNLSSSFIFWKDLSHPEPGNWNETFYDAFGCNSLSATTPIPTAEPYLPCQSWISFSYDESNALLNRDFKTQMSFISSALATITYPTRIRVSGGHTEVVSWKSFQTITKIQNGINNISQTPTSYLLLQQLAIIDSDLQIINGTTWPIGALIFIPDTSDDALANANILLPRLASVRLTFVLLGPNVDSAKLTNFSSNFIYWTDLTEPQPQNWDLLAGDAYGCSALPSPSSTPIPTSTPYLPCQSWISFSYDDSITLQNNDFKTQMTFISTAIGTINFPDRLRVNGAYTGAASWNSQQTIIQFQNEINSVNQSQVAYSLLQQLALLVTDLQTINGTSWPIGALIFISDTSDMALRNADRFLSQLAGIRLTFVLLGPNVDQYKLTNFSSNFIYWTDLTQPQPNNWGFEFFNAYGCSGLPSPFPTTTPVSTFEPYHPCQSWISFSYDDSDTLQNTGYKNQMSFISGTIDSINYPDRLRIGGMYSMATWNSMQTISQMQTMLNTTHQTSNPYQLLQIFANLATDFEALSIRITCPIGALIFISDTSDAALQFADRLLPQLNGIKITFVLLGYNVDSSKLTKFSSNFISWEDLSKPKPDNWDSEFANAYGCSGFKNFSEKILLT